VAFERFQTWRPMEGEEKTSLIGDQWKNILAWWLMEKIFLLSVQWKEKKKHSFHLLSLFNPKDFS
jgi:hypothetical protein